MSNLQICKVIIIIMIIIVLYLPNQISRFRSHIVKVIAPHCTGPSSEASQGRPPLPRWWGSQARWRPSWPSPCCCSPAPPATPSPPPPWPLPLRCLFRIVVNKQHLLHSYCRKGWSREQWLKYPNIEAPESFQTKPHRCTQLCGCKSSQSENQEKVWLVQFPDHRFFHHWSLDNRWRHQWWIVTIPWFDQWLATIANHC